MLNDLLQGFTKGGNGTILLILVLLLLFGGDLGDCFCGGGFDDNILFIFLIIFLIGGIF